jgi:4-diphosphocytidyl-2-C-methyl-D-erythritol kinase
VLRLKAPAKINLTLEVMACRDDGYHALRSLMVPVGIYDEIAVEPAAARTFACADERVGADNSVVKALAAAACAPVAVRLDKHIPIGGGLGGGSSDAAAVLRAAMEGQIPRAGGAVDWLAAARSLGSDVPFFLAGTGALVEGTGERVTAVGSLPPWWTVVVRPPVDVATAAAYRMLDDEREGAPQATRPRSTSASLDAVEALQRRDFNAVVALLGNDFERVVLRAFPDVARAHAALAEASGGRALLSGSGSCSFALFETQAPAREAAARIAASVAQSFVAPFASGAQWR